MERKRPKVMSETKPRTGFLGGGICALYFFKIIGSVFVNKIPENSEQTKSGRFTPMLLK